MTVEASTAIGDARFVGEGSNIDAAMQSLIGAVLGSPEGNGRGPHRWSRFDEGMRPQEGYFPMLGRRFIIDAPAKRNEQGHADELTDEEVAGGLSDLPDIQTPVTVRNDEPGPSATSAGTASRTTARSNHQLPRSSVVTPSCSSSTFSPRSRVCQSSTQ